MNDYTEQAKRYLILIEGGPPSNYSAWSPDIPGCAANGDTLEEVEREMRAAIAFHLEGLGEDGEPIPEPSGPGVYVERAAAVTEPGAKRQGNLARAPRRRATAPGGRRVPGRHRGRSRPGLVRVARLRRGAL
jgi:predicted RNase H-like HicB family nuclease